MTRFLATASLLVLASTTTAQPREVTTTPGMVFRVVVSPDGSLVAIYTVRIKLDKNGKQVGDGNEIIVLETTTGKERLNTGKSDLAPLGFTEKTLVLGGRPTFNEAHIQHWDLTTGKGDAPLILVKEGAYPLLSADGKTVTTVTKPQEAAEHTVETWNVSTGKSLGSFNIEAVKTLGSRQVADGPFLSVVQTTKGVGLLSRDPKSGKSVTAELAGATSATISPDGKWVVGHSSQGIKLFDSAGKQTWAAGGNFSQFACDVAGKFVIAKAGGGKVHLFDLAMSKIY